MEASGKLYVNMICNSWKFIISSWSCWQFEVNVIWKLIGFAMIVTDMLLVMQIKCKANYVMWMLIGFDRLCTLEVNWFRCLCVTGIWKPTQCLNRTCKQHMFNIHKTKTWFWLQNGLWCWVIQNDDQNGINMKNKWTNAMVKQCNTMSFMSSPESDKLILIGFVS